jgi:hypothetical protein
MLDSGQLSLKTPKGHIFYYEALSVLSAILHSTSFGFPFNKLVIYTDNLNTVHMFNSLLSITSLQRHLERHRRSPLIRPHNPIQLRVIHVPGQLNTVADALSRGQLHTVVDNVPGIVIDLFTPPRIRRESGAANHDPSTVKSKQRVDVLLGLEHAYSMSVLSLWDNP